MTIKNERSVIEELNSKETPEEIIGILREANIKGVAKNCEKCPVAQYLKQCGVNVACVRSWGICTDDIFYLNTPTLAATILRIDKGEYPEVIEEEGAIE